MIDKNKLKEYLVKRNAQSTAWAAETGGAEHYYQLGQASMAETVIIGIDSEKFDTEEGKHDSD